MRKFEKDKIIERFPMQSDRKAREPIEHFRANRTEFASRKYEKTKM